MSAMTPYKRAVVFARDDFTCRHCGSVEDLTIDHILPRCAGGGHSYDNLQTLCESCNLRKGGDYYGDAPLPQPVTYSLSQRITSPWAAAVV